MPEAYCRLKREPFSFLLDLSYSKDNSHCHGYRRLAGKMPISWLKAEISFQII